MMNLFYSHYNIENYTFKISIIINHTCPRLLHYILLIFTAEFFEVVVFSICDFVPDEGRYLLEKFCQMR